MSNSELNITVYSSFLKLIFKMGSSVFLIRPESVSLTPLLCLLGFDFTMSIMPLCVVCDKQHLI